MDNDGGGWRLFAGILILISGAFNVFDGLVGITQVNYIERNTGGQLPITNDPKTWSWVVLIIGAVMLIAGFLIFAGNMFGRLIGILRRQREPARATRRTSTTTRSGHSPWS